MRFPRRVSFLPKWVITWKRNTDPIPTLQKTRKVQGCRRKWTKDVIKKVLEDIAQGRCKLREVGYCSILESLIRV